MKTFIKVSTFLLLSAFLFSCHQDDIKEDQSMITIENITELSAKHSGRLQKEFSKLKILKDITGMSNFTITGDDILDKTFIQGEGVDGKGNAVVFRKAVNVELLKDGRYLINTNLKNVGGESCSGVNCSKCSFARGGGCDCDKAGDPDSGGSYCNHSISS